jgi:cobalt-zinc-cadmium efflux system outer membrane protein
MKDLIRLKAGYLKINSEKSESSLQLNEDMAKLKILLQTSSYVLTEVNSPFLDNLANEVPLTDLENKALKNRPDLAAGELDQRYAATFLKLSTDQRGGAFQNQINFGVSMPLPILNQNRGKISSAKFQLQSSAYLLNQLKSEVLSEVFSASQNMNRSIQEYKKSKGLYDQNFEKVLSSVNDNFKRRNMSILEFLDFLESYNDGLKEIERIKNQIAINAAQINFVTATKVY